MVAWLCNLLWTKAFAKWLKCKMLFLFHYSFSVQFLLNLYKINFFALICTFKCCTVTVERSHVCSHWLTHTATVCIIQILLRKKKKEKFWGNSKIEDTCLIFKGFTVCDCKDSLIKRYQFIIWYITSPHLRSDRDGGWHLLTCKPVYSAWYVTVFSFQGLINAG